MKFPTFLQTKLDIYPLNGGRTNTPTWGQEMEIYRRSRGRGYRRMEILKMNIACQYLHFLQTKDIWLKSASEAKRGVLLTLVNYHQFILGSNKVLFFNIANITLMSLWAVASTAIL